MEKEGQRSKVVRTGSRGTRDKSKKITRGGGGSVAYSKSKEKRYSEGTKIGPLGKKEPGNTSGEGEDTTNLRPQNNEG